MKAIFLSVLFIFLILSNGADAITYNGPQDWRAPKVMMCFNIPRFPKGIKVVPADVFGVTSDQYLFSQMDGVMGFYYFEMNYPPKDNVIHGVATYFDRLSMDWPMTKHDVSCNVLEWQ